MTTGTFALILIAIVCIAFITAWAAMHYQSIADDAQLKRMKWEARNDEREYWLRLKQAETEQLLAISHIFADCKELAIESPARGHLRLNMSRRDHAPLPLPAPMLPPPRQYITPTIIPPQPLYNGGCTNLSVIGGTPDKVWVKGGERIEITKIAD